MKSLTLLLLLTIAFAPISQAQIINADPGNYVSLIPTLTPSDTLLLAPGNYTDGLVIQDVVGTSAQPIVIMGSGNTTVFIGNSCCNTVSIKTSAFVTLQDFKLDGQNISNIDGVKAEGTTGNWAHHIELNNLLIVGHGANQQTVGISTKCPTWDWVIRECTIDGAGTGIYLGNSNGEDPFVNGIVEYNLIKNTIGYNMEIKHQNVDSRDIAGMTLDGKTIIRHNVFSKENNSSTGGSARPNLLVGNFPASGDGMNDHYEIYGNFLWQNPSESLFQGTGNIMFYDNVCVNYSGGYGVAIQSHNGFTPRDIKIFHNTIVSDVNWGLRLMDTDVSYQKYIYGNAVFSDHSTPIRIVGGGVSTANELDNIVGSISSANSYVNNAANNISTLDLYPIAGSGLNSTLIPNSLFTSYSDYSEDFNSDMRDWFYRGAYSGEGVNNGWHLAIDKKPVPETGTASISEFALNSSTPEIQLYPNPAAERAYLNFNSSVSNMDLKVINVQGQIEFEQDYNNVQDIELNTAELTKGIYFIKINTPEFSTVLKLIKK